MKPIGYWLQHVHELLESRFADALRADSLTRRHWQVLNTIALGARSLEDVDERLAPFVAEEGSMAPLLAEFRERGWLTDFTLTDAGRAAHTRVEATINNVRTEITAGISDDEYVATVRVLARMASNLESRP